MILSSDFSPASSISIAVIAHDPFFHRYSLLQICCEDDMIFPLGTATMRRALCVFSYTSLLRMLYIIYVGLYISFDQGSKCRATIIIVYVAYSRMFRMIRHSLLAAHETVLNSEHRCFSADTQRVAGYIAS